MTPTSPSSPATPGSADHDPLGRLLDAHTVVICTGSGGVGKTTTAAVLAMEAAHRGRRACVVTIDPARRLADAMGLAGLTDDPARVEGPWPGELWAMMLDTKSTFDTLVQQNASGPEQAAAILENRFYRNISGSLSGTQEYMAMEKLYELHGEERFDLVVVDTPPTRNALDFLDAPRRLTRFLDHRLYRVLVAPTRGLVRAVNVAAQTFVRTISRVVGAEVVQDAIGFFAAFDGMEDGFRARAAAVTELLASEETAFVLVTAPRRDVVRGGDLLRRQARRGRHHRAGAHRQPGPSALRHGITGRRPPPGRCARRHPARALRRQPRRLRRPSPPPRTTTSPVSPAGWPRRRW